MKTRDRILLTSLDLFNLCGEPNVTTIDIANELDISPGNLYYHFRNKDQIILELFLLFEASITDVLDVSSSNSPDVTDYWMYIHLIFENIWEYRFLYRDLSSILGRNEKLQKRFNRILEKKAERYTAIINAMNKDNRVSPGEASTQALVQNIALTTTYWINYQHICDMVKPDAAVNLDQGVYQVMSLFTPYLQESDKQLLEEIAASYL